MLTIEISAVTIAFASIEGLRRPTVHACSARRDGALPTDGLRPVFAHPCVIREQLRPAELAPNSAYCNAGFLMPTVNPAAPRCRAGSKH